MATITASMVKELRDKTGVGMMDCKKALQETNGDLEAAVDDLRKLGLAKAEKRGGRATKEGLVFVKTEGNIGAIIELNCETDFVARGDDFQNMGKAMIDGVFAGAPGADDCCVDTFLTESKNESGQAFGEMITDSIGRIGENQGLRRIERVTVESEEGTGNVASYIHPPGKLGVLLQMVVSDAASLETDDYKQLATDLTMQIAAANPLGLDRDSIPANEVERERSIYVDQAKNEGKPENIIDRIVDGKMNKFYKDNCLLDQDFVKDTDMNVRQRIEQSGVAGAKIVGFTRFEVGGGVDEENSED